jgi:hypothetical protein
MGRYTRRGRAPALTVLTEFHFISKNFLVQTSTHSVPITFHLPALPRKQPPPNPTTMPLDHISLVVPQPTLDPLITFLTTTLSHIGFKEIVRPIPDVVGLGEGNPYLWITGLVPEGVEDESLKKLLKGLHVAFVAESEF